MSSGTRDQLTDHEFDGIREYDNPCPRWWHAIFWGTFVFSVFYFVFFQFSTDAWTNADWYDGTVAANLRLQFAEIGDLTADEPTLLRFMHDEKWLTVGKTVYKGQCASCHAADGSGQVGPNLTDDNYKNVNVITDIAKVVAEGANNGAMPAWKTRLHPNEVVLVSAYVASLRGQNLTGPGIVGDEEIPPWPPAPEPAAETEPPADATP